MIEALKEITSERINNSPGGIQSKYIKLSDKWGAKITTDEGARDAAYHAQKSCFDLDNSIAPEVGETFEIKVGDKMWYGYITEHLMEFYPNFKWTCSVGGNRIDWNNNPKPTQCEYSRHFLLVPYRDQLMETKKQYSEAGFYFLDDHAGNLGFKGDKVVCIDFGDNDENCPFQ